MGLDRSPPPVKDRQPSPLPNQPITRSAAAAAALRPNDSSSTNDLRPSDSSSSNNLRQNESLSNAQNLNPATGLNDRLPTSPSSSNQIISPSSSAFNMSTSQAGKPQSSMLATFPKLGQCSISHWKTNIEGYIKAIGHGKFI